MLILTILGWILLLLLGLLVLILLLLFTALLAPVKLRLSYNREDGFYAGLRYLWIKKQLAPSPKDDGPKPPKPKKREKAAPEGRGKKAEASASGPVEKRMEDHAAAPEDGQKRKSEETSSPAAHIPPPPALRAAEEKLKKTPEGPEKSETDSEGAVPLKKDPPQPESPAPGAETKEDGKEAENGPPPAPEKETGANGQAAAQGQEENEDKIFAFSMDKLGTLIKTSGGFIKKVLQSLRYQDISLTLPVKGHDAADCALKFGRVNAALSGFFAACTISGLRYTFGEVRVFPDFSGEDAGGIRFSMTLRGQGLWVLTAVLWTVRLLAKEKILFPGGIPLFKKHKDKKDGGKKI